MARDDYFVIVYKILAYIYDCTKKGTDVNCYDVMNADSYGINEKYFSYILSEMHENGYIDGVNVSYSMDGGLNVYITNKFRIREKGIAFLQENTYMEKAYRAIKKARDIIPGI